MVSIILIVINIINRVARVKAFTLGVRKTKIKQKNNISLAVNVDNYQAKASKEG